MTSSQSLPARGTAITSVAPLLKKAVRDMPLIFDGTGVTEAPVAQFYDMDMWDQHLHNCKSAFGPTFQHAMAIKSNSVSKMLRHAFDKHGMGIECASIGEVLHAQKVGIPNSHIVFDSPCKTEAEQVYALREKIHTNLDNFVDFERARKFVKDTLKLDPSDSESSPGGVVGFRINPLVGSGEIAALSVSTAESKFGVAVTEKKELIKAYVENPWLNSMHIHVGSGGMGLAVLTGGIRVLVDLAKEINSTVNRKQIKHLDIGGGLPANYGSDAWATQSVPTHLEYAQHLRKEIPELFTGEFHVITEFGQSLFAKCGFLASRVEWMKGTSANPVAIVHFGADSCVRQVYGGADHKRRLEAYREDGSAFESGVQQRDTSVGGPLCFQGDFVAKNIRLPRDLKQRDIIVMKDAGASTISMFSRHCSRLCPPVYGYRWGGAEVSEIFELKPRESAAELSGFWGRLDEPSRSALGTVAAAARCNGCLDRGVRGEASGPGEFHRELVVGNQREKKIKAGSRTSSSSDGASTAAVPEDSASQQLSDSDAGARLHASAGEIDDSNSLVSNDSHVFPKESTVLLTDDVPKHDSITSARDARARAATMDVVPHDARARAATMRVPRRSSFPTMRVPEMPERITRSVAFLNALPANVLSPDRCCADGRGDASLEHGSVPSDPVLQNALVGFLASGSDDRILLDSRGCNKYNTPALPQPRGIHRSSCTSSCCTDYSFNKGERLVASLIDAAQITSRDGDRKYMQHITDIRSSIRKAWKLPDDESCGITLCPSGSDAEYLPLLLALVRMLAMPESEWGSGILSVVCAAGEVGSGTLNATTGKHFSDVSPKPGCHVKNNDAVFSLPESFPPVEAIEVVLRNKAGHVKCHDDVDDEVRDIVETALTEQNFRVVLVHMVTGSKTGHLVPSLSVLEELSQRWGKAVVPIVDACQGRLQEGALTQLLLRDMLVLVTGSKFYGGPPFSGMVLLPGGVSQEIDSSPYLHKHFRGRPFLGDLPLFMDDLCLSEDLPNMKQIIAERHGGERPYNWGIVVRWTLALNEITLFHRIPEPIRDSILCKWINSTRQLIADMDSPLLQCVETERDVGGASAESQVGMFAINTIVSLICRVQEGNPYKRLGLAELKKVHMLMGEDLSDVALILPNARLEATLPGPYGTHQVNTTHDVLATRCFIAQPVQLQPGFKFGLTVIRIAIGAPLVSWIFDKSHRLNMLDSSGIDKVVNLAAQSDFVLLQKLVMILEHWQKLKDYKPSQK